MTYFIASKLYKNVATIKNVLKLFFSEYKYYRPLKSRMIIALSMHTLQKLQITTQKINQN